jgi:peptide/nickel transport system permease protein
MIKLIVGRLLSAVPVLAGIVIVTFLAVRLVPGDVVHVLLDEYYDPQVAEQLRTLFGLDLPIHEQFFQWIGDLARGDLGDSLRTGRPVFTEISGRLPATMELAAAALLLSLLIGVPAGIISATRRNSAWDLGARLSSLVGLSVPNFFLGILLILLFVVVLGWLPSGGYVPLSEDPAEHFRHLILPTVTLGTALAAVTMRMTRSAMLEVSRQDYVRTAHAKGLLNRQVTLGHAFRNALMPVVTVVGIQLGSLLGGTVVVEEIFSWPGLGTLIIDGIQQRDYPIVQAGVMFFALFFVLANLLVDILYLYINPSLRNG